jgi:hypothetical protein
MLKNVELYTGACIPENLGRGNVKEQLLFDLRVHKLL